MKHKKLLFIFGTSTCLIGFLVIFLTLKNNSKIPFGYILSAIAFLIGIYVLFITFTDDSIKKDRLKEVIKLIEQKRKEFKIKSFLNNEICVVIEIEDAKLSYVSIFNKKMIIDSYTLEESEKINYLNNITDESLKKEGFNEIKRKKSSKKIKIKNLSANEIFDLIYKEILEKEN